MTQGCKRARGPILLTMVCVLTFSGAASTAAQAQAPAQQEKVSAKVVKPLKAAQEALQKKEWEQALARLAEADAVQGKTAFDQFVINEFRASALIALQRYAEAAPIYEQNFNSGKVPPAEVNDRLKRLTQLNAQIKNWPKVADFGSRWIKAGNKDADIEFIVGQAYFLQQDYKNALVNIEGAVKTAQESSRTPEENWLQMQQICYVKLNDAEGASRSVKQLLRYYPKPDYWDRLLSTRLTQRASDRVMLNLYRLANEVGVLKEPDEYLEMTEMLLDAGLPGEAKSVMEAGYRAKVFETEDKSRADRYSRRLNDAKAAAARDQQSLPTIEKEAQKSATGQGNVALGMAYSSFGQYDKAVPALAQGLQKGGVRDPDQAQIMLGIANLKLGKKAEAVKAFEAVADSSELNDVAELWILAAQSDTG